MNKIRLNWSDIYNYVEDIYNQIKNKDYKFIYGLPRGGLVPAVMLSHLSGLELIVEEPSDFTKKIELNFSHFVFNPAYKNHSNYRHPENTLILDDIYDRGNTLKPFLENGFNCYTLTGKELSHPNLYVSEKYKKDQWIVFPWETEKSSKIDYLENGKQN